MTNAALQKPRTMRITSSAFRQGEPIPAEFTCKGTDASPPLEIAGVPPGTKALALVMDDPDAPKGTWTHWTWWDFPASTMRIGKGVEEKRVGGVVGTTSDGSLGYHGPCPPSGTHRYVFRVFALAAPLGLREGADVESVWKALALRSAAWGELMGTFTKG